MTRPPRDSPPGPPATYPDYLRAVHAALVNRDNRLDRKTGPVWRVGQTHFNVLYQLRPDLADAARDTDLDPFHRDDRVPAFLRWLRRNWDGPTDD